MLYWQYGMLVDKLQAVTTTCGMRYQFRFCLMKNYNINTFVGGGSFM